MVVEDGEDDAFVLAHLLAKAGLAVTPLRFDTAEGAVRHLAGLAPEAMPQVVFVSVRLPDLDGYSVVKWIRQQEAFNGSVAILLGAVDEPRNFGKATRVGADAYMVKFPSPSEMRELLAEIERAIAAPFPRPALAVACNRLAALVV